MINTVHKLTHYQEVINLSLWGVVVTTRPVTPKLWSTGACNRDIKDCRFTLSPRKSAK